MKILRGMVRLIGRFIVFVIVSVVLLTALFATTYLYVTWPIEHENVEMTINAGTSVRKISDTLEEKKIIKCASCFRAYIALMGYGSRLRAGDYEFESGLTASDVVGKLLKGDFRTFKVTVVEGWTVNQIADYIRTLPFLENYQLAEEFRALAKDQEFIRSVDIGWETPTLEGYFFPSTYEIYKIKDARKLAYLMANEFKRRFSDVIKEKSAQVGLTPHQVVTIASIIEKETGAPEERPLIASVFYNRLKNGMLLQSDPTTIYGIENFDGNLRKQDLANPHRYNTYVHPGLPPGPIANPGEASIMAALNPAKSDYLYFVSRNDGTHVFSNSLSEHNRLVWEYQKSGNHRNAADNGGGVQ